MKLVVVVRVLQKKNRQPYYFYFTFYLHLVSNMANKVEHVFSLHTALSYLCAYLYFSRAEEGNEAPQPGHM